jgi:hypothetical protein
LLINLAAGSRSNHSASSWMESFGGFVVMG